MLTCAILLAFLYFQALKLVSIFAFILLVSAMIGYKIRELPYGCRKRFFVKSSLLALAFLLLFKCLCGFEDYLLYRVQEPRKIVKEIICIDGGNMFYHAISNDTGAPIVSALTYQAAYSLARRMKHRNFFISNHPGFLSDKPITWPISTRGRILDRRTRVSIALFLKRGIKYKVKDVNYFSTFYHKGTLVYSWKLTVKRTRDVTC